MAAAAATTTTVSPWELGSRRRSGWAHGIRSFIRRKPLGVIGAVMLLSMVFVAVLAPVLAPFDPTEFHASDAVQPPNSTYRLGTDEKGRDILSRVMYGAQISLRVGVIAVGLGTTFGLVAGLVSGYIGGRFDFFAQRVVDSFQALPALFLALAVTTALREKEWGIPGFGPPATKVGIALALATWAGASRVIRSSVLAQKQVAYVEAARSIGAQTPRIVFRHILPNVTSIYIVLATAGLAAAILTEASLSFLGAGVQPPTPSWGRMLLEAQREATRAPWMVIFPGIAITIAVFGFSLFGDALRDHLDPRLRGR
jgi:peptide/nickel transport system permease protein